MRVHASLLVEGLDGPKPIGLGDIPSNSQSGPAFIRTQDTSVQQAVAENVHEMSATYLDALGRRYVSRGVPAAGSVSQIFDDGSEIVVYNSRS